MGKVIAIAGFGPGIAHAVASLWGAKGFELALLSRTQERLDTAVEEFRAKGIPAQGYAVDLSQPHAVKEALGRVAAAQRPVSVLLWNPAAQGWGDLLSLDIGQVERDVALHITGLIAAVQAVVPEMEGKEGAAILVTGGGLALAAENPDIARAAGAMGGMALAAGKAGQRNLVYTLAEYLRPKGIRVAEVTVTGLVKGSALAGNGGGVVEPSAVAEDFWGLYSQGLEGPVSVIRGG